MSVTHLADIANAARVKVTDVLAPGFPSMPIQYDNHETDKAEYPDPIWVRVSVLPSDSKHVGTGTVGRFRVTGTMIVQIFQELGKGTADTLSVLDTIRDAFTSITEDGITWRVPTVNNIGRSGTWWQTNIVCPFYSDNLK